MADTTLIGNVNFDRILIFIFILLVTFFLANLFYQLLRRLFDYKLNKRVSKLLSRLVQYGTFTIGIYYGIFHILRLDVKAIAASLGIMGVAIAFASAQIIQNILAGILIAIERPIQLEDWIEVGGAVETGISRVKDITLKKTILRNRDGRVIYIPNSLLINSRIINYTKSGFIEVPIPLTLPQTVDFEKAKKIIQQVAKDNPKILPNVSATERSLVKKTFRLSDVKGLFGDKEDLKVFYPKIIVTDISNSKITISIRIWIRDINNKETIVSEFLGSLMKRFKAAGIQY